jgi:hypothetical protein
MNGREAEQTLSVIRTLMERGTQYRNLSGYAGIAAGVATLVGSVLRLWLHTPFVWTWLGVLVAACAAATFFTGQMAHANGEPLWTRQARTVVLALTPALIATLIITAVLARAHETLLLPGIWMLLWGVGALAMSFFTPRVISLLGITFMVAGAATLLLNITDDALSMGLTFGGIHLAYGVVLCLRQPGRAALGLGKAAEPAFREQ